MLEELKRMLGLSGQSDEELDQKLNWILDATRARLKVLLGGIDPGEDLNYIITEVSIIRYNRIGSEGFQSHSVEGESLAFSDDDFSGYREDIQIWLNNQKDAKRGRLRFL